jgi:DNA-binding MarR family transcriptional regulator
MDEATATAFRLLIADVYELAGRSRSTSEEIARRHGQTAARWHVMSVVTDGPATASTIARRLGQARQSVQRVIDDLLASGHLQACPNPDHLRSPLLGLTSQGRRQLGALVQDGDHDRAARLATAGLTRAQLEQARSTLRALLAALGP